MTRAWTSSELEAYLDGELPDADAELLSASLRADPSLRSRCNAIARADRLAHGALLGAGRGASVGSRRVGGLVGAALAMAACAAAAFVLWGPRKSAPEPAKVTAIAAAPTARDVEGHAGGLVRVVLTVHLPGPDSGAAVADGVTGVHEQHTAALADATDGGDAGDAALRRLGANLRSSNTARRALDELPPDEQLNACEAWAHAPHLRTVAFERLRELRRDGHEEDVRRVAGRLADNPVLRGWVASYTPMSPHDSARPF